jgi:copper chaperone CopZ
MNTITLTSSDIHCDSCAASIRKAVSAVEGVQSVDVDVTAQIVRVEFAQPADESKIIAAVDEAGFEVTTHK